MDRAAWVTGLVSVLKNRATWPGFFANAGLSGAFFAFAGLWAVPYLTQMHGMTRATASSHVSIYFLGFAIGSALWGRVSDALGRRKAVALVVSGLHVLGWGVWLWALMERTWDGRMEAGVRIYSAADWRNGLLLLTAAAVGGWLATLLVTETGCRNIWKAKEEK